MNDNTADGQARLLRMTFVEFLEFIGRIAIAKFFNSEMEELPLSEKISYILDDLFVVIGVQRQEGFTEEEVSDSDSDY